MTLFIASVTIALVVSFLCSLAEALLLSLNSTRLETLKRQGKGYARVWISMKQNVDRPIAAILILNTVAHTGGATVAGGAFDSIFGSEGIWIFSTVFTILVLFGTELAPKVIGVAYAEKIAPIFARPLYWATVVLRPLLFVTEAFSRLFRPRGQGGIHGDNSTEAADLVTLARLARSKLLIEPNQEQIIINAAQIREKRVSEAMIPVDEIVLFDIRKPTADNVDLARQTLHTRYPVTEDGEPSGIIGFVNLKEIFAVSPENRAKTLEPFLHGISNIDPEMSIGQALQILSTRRQHIAVVRDKNRDVQGMLTMEDIVQEIVGEYEDELDVFPADVVRLGEHRWQIGAGVSMEKVRDATHFAPGEDEPEGTLGDFLLHLLPSPVRKGSSVAIDQWKFQVQVVRRGEPYQVLVEHQPSLDPAQPQARVEPDN